MKIFSIRKGKLLIIIGAGAALAVALFCIGRKPSPVSAPSDPSSPNGSIAQTQLTDYSISELLAQNLPQNSPVTDLSAHISKDGDIRIDCTLLSQAISDFCNGYSLDIPTPIRFMLTMLPEKVPVSFSMHIALVSQSGGLALSPRSLTVNGMDISPNILPDEFELNINRAINGILFKSGEKIRSLELDDGKISITLAEK